MINFSGAAIKSQAYLSLYERCGQKLCTHNQKKVKITYLRPYVQQELLQMPKEKMHTSSITNR